SRRRHTRCLSDWSSDVCSSDLLRGEVTAMLREAARRGRELGVLVEYELLDKRPVEQCDLAWKRNFVTHTGHVHPCCYTSQRGDQIGRASCRESVEVLVVALER